jgi:hypothetical protein
MDVSGQLYTSATLLWGIEPMVSIRLEAGWALESVWVLLRILQNFGNHLSDYTMSYILESYSPQSLGDWR